jgi:hypothetical protein
LVCSVMEYGAEVDSEVWEEAEVMQRMAGRMCLGVGRSVPNAVVMGEMGWWTVRARREFLRVAYWGKVVRERAGSVVRCVYEEGRRRIERGVAGKREWCVETRRLLVELGLGELWETEDVGEEKGWKAMVRGVMQEREEMRWRKSMVGKTTLERYMRVKTTLRKEWFLGESRVWVRRWVMMRASATCLEVTVGRWNRVRLEERVCGWCESGEVEDEEHFLDGCEGGKRMRGETWNEMRVGGDEQAVKRIEGCGREERVDWVMKGGCSVRTRGILIKAVGRWLFGRETRGRGRLGGGWVRVDKARKKRSKVAGASKGRVGVGRVGRGGQHMTVVVR